MEKEHIIGDRQTVDNQETLQKQLEHLKQEREVFLDLALQRHHEVRSLQKKLNGNGKRNNGNHIKKD